MALEIEDFFCFSVFEEGGGEENLVGLCCALHSLQRCCFLRCREMLLKGDDLKYERQPCPSEYGLSSSICFCAGRSTNLRITL